MHGATTPKCSYQLSLMWISAMYNTRADTLSKAGLKEDMGYLTLSEICDGEAIEEVRMQLF